MAMRGYRDFDTLEELYVDQRMSQYEIADKFGVSRSTIGNWMDKHGIPVRSVHERNGNDVPNLRTGGQGYEVAWSAHKGHREQVSIHRLCAVAWFGYENVVGNEVHHTENTPWLNVEWGLELKSKGEHAAHHHNERREKRTDPWTDKDTLAEALQSHKIRELARKWDTTHTTIRRWIDRFDLD